MYRKVSPETAASKEGFTRDMANTDHFGTGQIEARTAQYALGASETARRAAPRGELFTDRLASAGGQGRRAPPPISGREHHHRDGGTEE